MHAATFPCPLSCKACLSVVLILLCCPYQPVIWRALASMMPSWSAMTTCLFLAQIHGIEAELEALALMLGCRQLTGVTSRRTRRLLPRINTTEEKHAITWQGYKSSTTGLTRILTCWSACSVWLVRVLFSLCRDRKATYDWGSCDCCNVVLVRTV